MLLLAGCLLWGFFTLGFMGGCIFGFVFQFWSLLYDCLAVVCFVATVLIVFGFCVGVDLDLGFCLYWLFGWFLL